MGSVLLALAAFSSSCLPAFATLQLLDASTVRPPQEFALYRYFPIALVTSKCLFLSMIPLFVPYCIVQHASTVHPVHPVIFSGIIDTFVTYLAESIYATMLNDFIICKCGQLRSFTFLYHLPPLPLPRRGQWLASTAPPLPLLNPLVHLLHSCLSPRCHSPLPLPKRGRWPASTASPLLPHVQGQHRNPVLSWIHLKRTAFVQLINF